MKPNQAKAITIANRKGGVAKTTTTYNLGAELTRRGHSVLFIDLDSQGNLTYLLTASKSSTSSILDLMLDDGRPGDYIVEVNEKTSLLPSTKDLSTADVIMSQEKIGREYKLREALEPILSDYDYILIDTPPALDSLVVNSLVLSDYVIIPTTATFNSIMAIADLDETIKSVKKYSNKDLEILGVLVTIFNQRTNLAKQYKENIAQMAASIGTTTFNTVIREANVIREAEALNSSVFDLKRSKASDDYKAFTDEVLERTGVKDG